MALLSGISRSTVTLVNGLFLLLAVALLGALAPQVVDAWSELRLARRAVALAEADRVLFDGSSALRLTRGGSQDAVLGLDDPRPRLEEIRREAQAGLDTMLASTA
ncbi:MAG TPA: hypothetical protein VGC80_11960, partial [Acetobacteraceae bacterium]